MQKNRRHKQPVSVTVDVPRQQVISGEVLMLALAATLRGEELEGRATLTITKHGVIVDDANGRRILEHKKITTTPPKVK